MEGTAVLERLVAAVERIADRLAPPPSDIVDSRWIADRLGCTTTWIAELVRTGEIARECVLVGTGNGKPWKFHRPKIEQWLAAR